MIICNDEMVVIKGDRNEVLAEATCILHSVFEKMVEEEGKDEALVTFAEMGRLAVMTEDEVRAEASEKIAGAIKEMFEGGMKND